jgi:hypothetical protein
MILDSQLQLDVAPGIDAGSQECAGAEPAEPAGTVERSRPHRSDRKNNPQFASASTADGALSQYSALVAHVQNLVAARYISVYPRLVELTGSVNAGVMLSSCLYWTRASRLDQLERQRASHARAHAGKDGRKHDGGGARHQPLGMAHDLGWFWKTREDWRRELGLGRYEQENARRTLLEAGLLREQQRGEHARMHFWADEQRVYAMIRDHAAFVPGADLPPVMANETVPAKSAMHRALGLMVPLSTTVMRFTGDLNACLVLSRLFSYLRFQSLAHRRDGWMVVNVESLAQELGMGRFQIERARGLLVASGLVAEQLTHTVDGR